MEPLDPTPPATAVTPIEEPPPARGSLAIRVTPLGGYALATSYTGPLRWSNVMECVDATTVCIGATPDDPITLQPNLDLGIRGMAFEVGGVALEPGFGGECSPAYTVASFETTDASISVRVAGTSVELPVLEPLVELEAPAIARTLSFRWEPAGQPMHLQLVPFSGPQLPVVLPVDDTGALDLPFDQLGLHPDVLGFGARLVRGYTGTVPSGRPLDWSLSTSLWRYVEGAGDRLQVTPDAVCTDASVLEPGRYQLATEATGYFVIDAVPEGQVLRIRHGVDSVSVWSSCAGAMEEVARAEHDLLLPAGGPRVLEVDLSNFEPARLDLALEPAVAVVDLPDTCAEVDAPVEPAVYRLDRSAYSDTVIVPVVVPAGALLTANAAGARGIAVRDQCSVATSCVADVLSDRVVWRNLGAADQQVYLVIDWEAAGGLTDLVIDIAHPEPLAPSDACDGPVLQRSTSVEGSLEGLTSTELGGCWWSEGPKPDGTYQVELEAGERIQIDANWHTGWFELLDSCEDTSSVVASGTSWGNVSDPLVFENAGDAHTYTLRLRGSTAPYVLRVR